jgi:hypothetical protein
MSVTLSERHINIKMIKEFKYELGKAGWAKVKMLNESNIGGEFIFSYLSDPLSDLIASLNKLLKNVTSFEFVSFAQEPGEIILLIDKIDSERIQLEIYYHNDLTFEMDIEKIKQNFRREITEGDCLSNFSKLVYAETKRLYEEYGEIGYKNRWLEYDFPTNHYHELETLLKSYA